MAKHDFMVSVDKGAPIAFREFARLNAADPELCREVLRLKPGATLRAGGGAWATATVRRLPAAPTGRAVKVSAAQAREDREGLADGPGWYWASADVDPMGPYSSKAEAETKGPAAAARAAHANGRAASWGHQAGTATRKGAKAAAKHSADFGRGLWAGLSGKAKANKRGLTDMQVSDDPQDGELRTAERKRKSKSLAYAAVLSLAKHHGLPKRFGDDLHIWDKRAIEANGDDAPFVWVGREDGSHLIYLGGVRGKDQPAATYIRAILQNYGRETPVFAYWNGSHLYTCTAAEAEDKAKEFDKKHDRAARANGSGARQRARGTRKLPEYDGQTPKGDMHARWMDRTADYRRQIKPGDKTLKRVLGEDWTSPAEWARTSASMARDYRPALPNGSGAKQRARGTREFRADKTLVQILDEQPALRRYHATRTKGDDRAYWLRDHADWIDSARTFRQREGVALPNRAGAHLTAWEKKSATVELSWVERGERTIGAVRVIQEGGGWRADHCAAVAGAWMPWEAVTTQIFPTSTAAKAACRAWQKAKA